MFNETLWLVRNRTLNCPNRRAILPAPTLYRLCRSRIDSPAYKIQILTPPRLPELLIDLRFSLDPNVWTTL